MIWEERKWIIIVAIAVFAFILLDEFAYSLWKKTNPGTQYSHLFGKKNLTIIDPSQPPSFNYE